MPKNVNLFVSIVENTIENDIPGDTKTKQSPLYNNADNEILNFRISEFLLLPKNIREKYYQTSIMAH